MQNSNQNSGKSASSEWGSKARKAEEREHRGALRRHAIRDAMED